MSQGGRRYRQQSVRKDAHSRQGQRTADHRAFNFLLATLQPRLYPINYSSVKERYEFCRFGDFHVCLK